MIGGTISAVEIQAVGIEVADGVSPDPSAVQNCLPRPGAGDGPGRSLLVLSNQAQVAISGFRRAPVDAMAVVEPVSVENRDPNRHQSKQAIEPKPPSQLVDGKERDCQQDKLDEPLGGMDMGFVAIEQPLAHQPARNKDHRFQVVHPFI